MPKFQCSDIFLTPAAYAAMNSPSFWDSKTLQSVHILMLHYFYLCCRIELCRLCFPITQYALPQNAQYNCHYLIHLKKVFKSSNLLQYWTHSSSPRKLVIQLYSLFGFIFCSQFSIILPLFVVLKGLRGFFLMISLYHYYCLFSPLIKQKTVTQPISWDCCWGEK